ncbi:alpha/beta hydrolase domain-containing protein [Cadophora sp. DSE1049]|nr:alpha/beta hydrolase domain-containing protein [Cadophora sp. DSE1049]
MSLPRPPIDPQFVASFEAVCKVIPRPTTREILIGLRPIVGITAEKAVAGLDLSHTEYSILAPDNTSRRFTLSVFQPNTPASTPRGCVYFIHGGGMISGNQFSGVRQPLEWAIDLDLIIVSIDYGLAPEHPGRSIINDCYSGLQYLISKAGSLGIDPTRVMVGGGSAGGGLAAGIALMCRDKPDGPQVFAQWLACPMLDDRNSSVSSAQFVDYGIFNTQAGIVGWECYIGKCGAEDVSYYCAPARAKDLSGLPPAFVSVGACEPFRDECIEYASRLLAEGVSAELHVWAGVAHGTCSLATQAEVSKSEIRTTLEWIKRMFTPGPRVELEFA